MFEISFYSQISSNECGTMPLHSMNNSIVFCFLKGSVFTMAFALHRHRNYLYVLSWIWYWEVIRKDNASWNLGSQRLLRLNGSRVVVHGWRHLGDGLWSATILHRANIHGGLSLHCGRCGSLSLCGHRL